MSHKSHRHGETLRKIIAVVLCALITLVLHWAIFFFATPVWHLPMYVLAIGAFGVNLTFFQDTGGVAFGFFDSHPRLLQVTRLVELQLSLILLLVMFTLVPWTFKWQVAALTLWLAPMIPSKVESLVAGYTIQYFDIYFGTLHLPIFNVYTMVSTVGFLLLLGLILRHFLHKPRYEEDRSEESSAGEFHDPLYEKRRPLKIFIGMMAIGASLLLVLVASLAYTSRLREATLGDLLIVLIAMMYPGIVIWLWKLVPRRGVDVLFLRSFAADRRGWKLVRRLRRALSPDLRVTGVVDPKRTHSWFSALFWLYFAFVFSLGELSRVRVTRHNAFLDGNWRAGIKAGFASARAAVFDCRTVGPNLLWEVGVGVKSLGPDRAFFLLEHEMSSAEFSKLLEGAELPAQWVQAIPRENRISSDKLKELAERLRTALVLIEPHGAESV